MSSCITPVMRCATRCKPRRVITPRSCTSGSEPMHRILAIIERDLRRFRRSPTLIIVSMVMPLVQLIVLGYAFGGKVKHLSVGVVDQDHGVQGIKLREMFQAVAANARTFDTVAYVDEARALEDLRNG